MLLDSGAQPSRAATPDRAPAILAMNRNHMELVKFLVSRGADVTLHLAAYIGDIERAQTLIRNGSDVNARGQAGETPLHMVVCGGHRDLAELLISRGADVNAHASLGWTPLHEAAWHGRKEIAELLVSRGAAVSAKTIEDSSRNYFPYVHAPLHKAAQMDLANVARVLIAHGANVRAWDRYGKTPLHTAACFGSTSVVEVLLAHGADPNARKSRYDLTPLSYARGSGFVEVARLLGGDPSKLVSGPYRVVITDPNSIEAFVGPQTSVDEVWVPNETQLKEFEAAISRLLRERAAPHNEYERTLVHLRRCHREYAGFTYRGKKHIACYLNCGEFIEKPIANRFGIQGGRWGPYKLLFDAGSKTIVEPTT